MSKQDFDTVINQVVKKHDESIIDWNKTRNDWLEYLKKFYEKVEHYLADYKNEGKLSYTFSEKEIFEEYIGSYTVDVMRIKLADERRVELKPIGRNIIGARGRVDLIGANGKVKFVLVNKDYSAPPPIKVTIREEGELISKTQPTKAVEKEILDWKIATPPPRIKYIDLNEDVFFDAMLEVIGG